MKQYDFIFREFVTTTILPRFRRAVDQMLSLPSHYIISALHETIMSVESIVDKVRLKVSDIINYVVLVLFRTLEFWISNA